MITNQAEIVSSVRDLVFEKLDLVNQVSDEEVWHLIRHAICEYSKLGTLSIEDRNYIGRVVFNSIRGLDVLSELIEDEDITEILINGPEDIFIEKGGCLQRANKSFSSREKLDDVIQQIVGSKNQVVNESVPICDTRLDDGSRVNIVLPPVAVDAPVVSIRRFAKEAITLSKMVELNSMSCEVARFLMSLVRAKVNIFISGGTGSGKTTLLNALTEYIPFDERVVTIEDAAELQVIGVDNLVRLEARSANLEGDLEVPIRDLVKASLRMRPNRIIVGECRGAEAIEMLQACNTGHDGSLSTGHANSTTDMISRLETMVLQGMEIPIVAIRKQIASAIDVFVHIGRLADGRRRLIEISEVLGIENGEIKLSKLYEYNYGDEGEEEWIHLADIYHRQKLERVKS